MLEVVICSRLNLVTEGENSPHVAHKLFQIELFLFGVPSKFSGVRLQLVDTTQKPGCGQVRQIRPVDQDGLLARLSLFVVPALEPKAFDRNCTRIDVFEFDVSLGVEQDVVF